MTSVAVTIDAGEKTCVLALINDGGRLSALAAQGRYKLFQGGLLQVEADAFLEVVEGLGRLQSFHQRGPAFTLHAKLLRAVENLDL